MGTNGSKFPDGQSDTSSNLITFLQELKRVNFFLQFHNSRWSERRRRGGTKDLEMSEMYVIEGISSREERKSRRKKRKWAMIKKMRGKRRIMSEKYRYEGRRKRN